MTEPFPELKEPSNKEVLKTFLPLIVIVIIIIGTGAVSNYIINKLSEPVTITVYEKFCNTDAFTRGCYVTDYSQKNIWPNSENFHIRDSRVFDQMKYGKTYRCYNYNAGIQEMFDINPNHQYLKCVEIPGGLS